LSSSKSWSVTSPFLFGGKRTILNARTIDDDSLGSAIVASYHSRDPEGCSILIKHLPKGQPSERAPQSYFSVITGEHMQLCDLPENLLKPHDLLSTQAVAR
jgi:hypothetical protein